MCRRLVETPLQNRAVASPPAHLRLDFLVWVQRSCSKVPATAGCRALRVKPRRT